MEILEFRKALETEVIRLAVERASDQEIRELEKIYQKMCKASETSNLDEYFNFDGQFHQCLFDMSKNSLFIGIFQILSQLLLTHYQATVKKSWEVDGVPAVVQDDEHYNIVMGLKERNVELAVDTYVTMIDAKIAMFSMQEFRHS
jgi:GntR family transcriptional repressor for pyruvate dehydrogenase complex